MAEKSFSRPTAAGTASHVPKQLVPSSGGLTLDPTLLHGTSLLDLVSTSQTTQSLLAAPSVPSQASSYFTTDGNQPDAFAEAMQQASSNAMSTATASLTNSSTTCTFEISEAIATQRTGSVQQTSYPVAPPLHSQTPLNRTLVSTPIGSQTGLPHGTVRPSQTGMLPPRPGPTGFSPPIQTGVLPPPPQKPQAHVSPLEQTQAGATSYLPVTFHWFYYKLNSTNSGVWKPFSKLDSAKLEQALATGQTKVSTDGGRYDVSVPERSRKAIYWPEQPSEVRRCSWFSKLDTENRFVPYTEAFSTELEGHYRDAVLTGSWHRRHECSTGETVVVHSPTLLVHYQAAAQPDEWGTAMGEESRPRVVRRGVGDWEQLPEGEDAVVDHLVFVVHGIGRICDLRLRNIFEVVDDLRASSNSLLRSHYTAPVSQGELHRVEYLPIEWHTALHSDTTGIDAVLQRITLRSAPKLREYANDVIADCLYYTSPKYCQTIVDTVCNEINRLYALFKQRNPAFSGSVSLIGHSLGSVILFDLLSHQGEDALSRLQGHAPEVQTSLPVQSSDMLEALCQKLGLAQFVPKLQAEHIDAEALLLCSEEDLKELGLPLGARRKLMEHIRLSAQTQGSRASTPDSQAQRAPTSIPNVPGGLLRNASVTDVSFTVSEGAGTGQPTVRYPLLDFKPQALFALGSPIALFLAIRGISTICTDYKLPTCPRLYNIFHPYDAVAYRI